MAKKKVRQRRGILHRDMSTPEKWIAFVLFIALCVTTYFIMPISRVSTIAVVGTEDIDAQQIRADSGIVPNQTLLSAWLQSGRVKETISKKFYRVDTVDVTIGKNNVYQLTIKEHATIATVEIDNQYYSVLASGVVLQENSRKYIGTVPSVRWRGNMESLEIAMREFAKVDAALRFQVSEITYSETDRLIMTIYMTDGNQVKVNYTEFANKMNYYEKMKNIIKDKKGIIDLTVGSYFSPYE